MRKLSSLVWLSIVRVRDSHVSTRVLTGIQDAGLTGEERDIVADAYDRGILKVIVATCSLAAGINLPARRVILQGARMGLDMVGPAMLQVRTFMSGAVRLIILDVKCAVEPGERAKTRLERAMCVVGRKNWRKWNSFWRPTSRPYRAVWFLGKGGSKGR